MLGLVAKTLQTESFNFHILEAAFELYLQAPESQYPVISLHEVAERTGASLLECRNTIVTACKRGRFPDCSLSS
ncbi:hypothetical protein [Almyronema epifaneia]|uniref:Uncharacterized protein n=1 Tax=Almyronema epifaneia S1 TaxID=2991925 RepID=A0ABW6IGB1_9CYAN